MIKKNKGSIKENSKKPSDFVQLNDLKISYKLLSLCKFTLCSFLVKDLEGLCMVNIVQGPEKDEEFFCLTVNYREIGKSRKSSDKEILISRLIDKVLRPILTNETKTQFSVNITLLKKGSDSKALAVMAVIIALNIFSI